MGSASNDKNNSLAQQPLYTAKGFLSEEKVHLGSYFLNPGDKEDCFLAFENGNWYLIKEVLWPVYRGASNGGQSKNKLDTAFLSYHNIYTLHDLLQHIYSGNLAPCLDRIKAHNNVLTLLDELLKSKTAPNYNFDGVSLLWDFNDNHDGVIIHKCFSIDKNIIVIPDVIENCPVIAFGSNVFEHMTCHKLLLPNTLKKLDGVRDCHYITEITIPSSTEKCCPFLHCNSLEDIIVADGNKSFCAVNGVLYTYDQSTLIRCPEGKRGQLKIPEKTTTIGDWACADCQLLTDVKLPSALSKVGMEAFINCKNVEAFILPESINNISWGAFANIERNRIFCKDGSYAYNYLKQNFS